MKSLVLAVALMGMAGTVEALDCKVGGPLCDTSSGETYLKLTQAELDKMQADTELQYGNDAYLRVVIIDPPCLARMESAMTAMEPYSAAGHVKASDIPPGETSIAKHAQGIGFEIMYRDETIRALKLWESVKRDCLSKP